MKTPEQRGQVEQQESPNEMNPNLTAKERKKEVRKLRRKLNVTLKNEEGVLTFRVGLKPPKNVPDHLREEYESSRKSKEGTLFALGAGLGVNLAIPGLSYSLKRKKKE